MTLTQIEPSATVDPISALVRGRRAGHQQTTLRRIAVAVRIVRGLAVVETTRAFRNDLQTPIEALLSFPVPVQATFFGLEVRLDGSTHRGVAQA